MFKKDGWSEYVLPLVSFVMMGVAVSAFVMTPHAQVEPVSYDCVITGESQELRGAMLVNMHLKQGMVEQMREIDDLEARNAVLKTNVKACRKQEAMLRRGHNKINTLSAAVCKAYGINDSAN